MLKLFTLMRQKFNPLSQNWIRGTSFVRLQEFQIVILLTALDLSLKCGTTTIFYQSKNILKKIGPLETSSGASGRVSVFRYVEEAGLLTWSESLIF